MSTHYFLDFEMLKDVLQVVKDGTFVCDVCGKIIFPEVSERNDGIINVTSNMTSEYGGPQNKILLCSECAKN